MGYLRAASEFAILVHLFACLWIYIGYVDGQWMTAEERSLSDMEALYVESIYFTCTTMTSIGYGTPSAFGNGMWSMVCASVSMFFGILGFAIIKHQIFT